MRQHELRVSHACEGQRNGSVSRVTQLVKEKEIRAPVTMISAVQQKFQSLGCEFWKGGLNELHRINASLEHSVEIRSCVLKMRTWDLYHGETVHGAGQGTPMEHVMDEAANPVSCGKLDKTALNRWTALNQPRDRQPHNVIHGKGKQGQLLLVNNATL